MPKSSRELLFSLHAKDFEIQTFSSGGAGGQHRDHGNSAVRFIHHPSGARGESSEDRSQLVNRRTALKRLTKDPRFIWWVRQESLRLTGKKTAEEKVDEMLKEENLLVEVRDEKGTWVKKNG